MEYSPSFYILEVQQSGWERFGPRSEDEFGHEHYLLRPDFVILGRAKAPENNILFLWRPRSHPQLVPAAPPATRCSTHLSGLQDFCKAWGSSHHPTLSSCLFPALFFFALLKAASIVHSYWRILQAVSPMQQNSIILCRRLVSISCFEDNCSTTNSLLNTHLHFLEVLSNYCLWGWRFLCLISVQWWFPCM